MTVATPSTGAAHRGLRILTFVFVLAIALGIVNLDRLTAGAPDFDQACVDGDPYYVASAFRAQSGRGRRPDTAAPSVILFRDTPSDNPQFELASFADTGSVFGLAYSRGEPAIYSGAYRKRGLPYGPGGAGGIYRTDLDTGVTELWTQVPDAGTQIGGRMADGERDQDDGAAREVGKVALGDLEVNDAGTELFAVNLNNRKIYRFDLATKAILSEFDMGAMSEDWGPVGGRPFGLAWYSGRLYHGVVNSRGSAANMVSIVYSSRPDGSDMQQVAVINMRYPRDGVRLRNVVGSQTSWSPWSDEIDRKLNAQQRPEMHRPQPMLTDLAITNTGVMVVGLRDRHWDISLQWIRDDERYATSTHGGAPTPTPFTKPGDTLMSEEGLGFGDIIHGTLSDGTYKFVPRPEHFDDTNALSHDESATGGVAWIPDTDRVVATSYGVKRAAKDTLAYEGVYWYELAGGNQVSEETVGAPGFTEPYDVTGGGPLRAWAHGPWVDTLYIWNFLSDIGSLGDTEVLCIYQPQAPTPSEPLPSNTPTASDTPVATATATDTPTRTPTRTPSPMSTEQPSATPRVLRPAYLPILLREHCAPEWANADTVLVFDNSSSMAGEKIDAARQAALAFLRAVELGSDQIGLVVFSEEAQVISPLSGDGPTLEAAIRGIDVAYGTRIDRGLAAARRVLEGPERKPDNSPMIVLLTDGIQVGDPEPPQTLARAIRESGVALYIVGLGQDLDFDYLEALAGDRTRLRLSPNSAELAAIYEAIARLIPCAPEVFWGRR